MQWGKGAPTPVSRGEGRGSESQTTTDPRPMGTHFPALLLPAHSLLYVLGCSTSERQANHLNVCVFPALREHMLH